MKELSLKRLRRANAVYFFISGFGYSSWTSRIPGIKESLKLNDAHFGTLLFHDARGTNPDDAIHREIAGSLSKAEPSC